VIFCSVGQDSVVKKDALETAVIVTTAFVGVFNPFDQVKFPEPVSVPLVVVVPFHKTLIVIEPLDIV